jgi:hypothetical protein
MTLKHTNEKCREKATEQSKKSNPIPSMKDVYPLHERRFSDRTSNQFYRRQRHSSYVSRASLQYVPAFTANKRPNSAYPISFKAILSMSTIIPPPISKPPIPITACTNPLSLDKHYGCSKFVIFGTTSISVLLFTVGIPTIEQCPFSVGGIVLD